MAVFYEGGKSLAGESEAVGLLAEGAAAIAVIVLTIIGLSQTEPGILAAISTIIVGGALMVQGFNTAAEYSRVAVVGLRPDQLGTRAAVATRATDVSGDVMVNFAAGIAGIVLGILGLLGIHTIYLIPAAVIVFGADLVLAGALGLGRGPVRVEGQTAATAPEVSAQTAGSAGAGGIAIIAGFAAVVLGILAVVLTAATWALALVGLLVVGAALLVVSASFSGALVRLFMATTG